MLITFLVLGSFLRVVRKRQRKRLIRRRLRRIANATHQLEARSPLLRAALTRYRKDVALAEDKRARSRKAISRLSRISERMPAKRYPLRIRTRPSV
jgi:hypothetical protein